MSIWARISGSVLVSLASLSLGSSVWAAPLSIKISSSLPEQSFAGVFLREFKERVETALPDEVELEIFMSGALGSEQDVLQGLQLGTHMATLSASGVTEINQRTVIFDLPYLIESRDQIPVLMASPAGDLLREGFEGTGARLLAVWDNGFRVITNNVRPVTTPADLAGLRIRTPSSRFRVEMFRELGANPTPLSFNEVYSALDQGVIDGQENPADVVVSARLPEVQDYLSVSNHIYLPTYLLFSEQTLAQLSPDAQATLEEIAIEMGDWSRAWGEENDQTIMAELAEIMEINEVNFAAFQEAASPLYNSSLFIDAIGADMIEATLAALGTN
ncbi:MAG: TRAP transporter substrate-binding protein [Synechococcaceae cyanobacterium SM2_3_60]|nr:TRAP transporter substrate-binding protein [Synechococcaceae cyanobacterium SM2_3_60]